MPVWYSLYVETIPGRDPLTFPAITAIYNDNRGLFFGPPVKVPSPEWTNTWEFRALAEKRETVILILHDQYRVRVVREIEHQEVATEEDIRARRHRIENALRRAEDQAAAARDQLNTLMSNCLHPRLSGSEAMGFYVEGCPDCGYGYSAPRQLPRREIMEALRRESRSKRFRFTITALLGGIFGVTLVRRFIKRQKTK